MTNNVRMRRRLIRLLLVVAACPAAIDVLHAQGGPSRQARATAPASRVVSLVPAVTEMLFAIGAAPQVLAVSSFDRFPREVEQLPRVGALLDPDTERILTLKPDLVIVYASQADLQDRFTRAGIRTYVYGHGGLDNVLRTMTELGAVTGRQVSAATVVNALRARLDGIRTRVAGRPRPRTLLVFGRQAGTLRSVYASGGVGFLHDLLGVAGATNVFADVPREAAQPSQEDLLTRRPDVIVELHGGTSRADVSEVRRLWSPLASVPAVRNGRVHALSGDYLLIAGPRLGDTAEAIARTIHPDAFR
jgi:iron complex transport system substrate-binding protein